MREVTINATPGQIARLAAALDLYSQQCAAEGNWIEKKYAEAHRDTFRKFLLERAVSR